MNTILEKITALLQKLPASTVEAFYNSLLTFDTPDEEDKEEIPACPYCNKETKRIRYGKKHGKQRFLCADCKKTYLATTNTVRSMSHFGIDIWREVLADTLSGYAMSYTEKRLQMSHQAVFNMRHKILLALEQYNSENPVMLSDVSELDETFVLESYKGKPLTASGVTRKPRKHGAKAQKRGISSEYICLCTGVQREVGKALIKSVNRAKPSSAEIDEIFDNHIDPSSLAITDGLRSYNTLTSTVGCAVIDCTSRSASFYHLNTVNNLHSFIKQRYNFYRGVATKYLNRYGTMFQFAYRLTDKIEDSLFTYLMKPGSVTPNKISDVKSRDLLLI